MLKFYLRMYQINCKKKLFMFMVSEIFTFPYKKIAKFRPLINLQVTLYYTLICFVFSFPDLLFRKKA